MNILVLNCGSSTLKFQVINTDAEAMRDDRDLVLARGVIERIGSQSLIRLSATGRPDITDAQAIRDHRAAVDHVLRWVVSDDSGVDGIHNFADIHMVSHRVVHGGEAFKKSILIDSAVEKGIEDCIPLAPLHNPANLQGIRAARDTLGPAVPQVAVFDTAFHAEMPESAFLYAIPYQYYRRHKIRRYGFHGSSHRYVAFRYRQLTGKSKPETRIITFHLGNGCSACAIVAGRSIDTSMGLTPLEGLVMGTRSGDLDPAVLEYLAHLEGISLAELDVVLNKQSGLLGISGLTNDMRELLAEQSENADRRASLAIDIFCYRARKYLGAYLAAMGGADAVVFTGGIGENAATIRNQICQDMEWAGIALDSNANTAMIGGNEGVISKPQSNVQVWVIPTNEELLMARDACRIVPG